VVLRAGCSRADTTGTASTDDGESLAGSFRRHAAQSSGTGNRDAFTLDQSLVKRVGGQARIQVGSPVPYVSHLLAQSAKVPCDEISQFYPAWAHHLNADLALWVRRRSGILSETTSRVENRRTEVSLPVGV